MNKKGFVLEGDHPWAYSMQYMDAVKEINFLLNQYGYNGQILPIGNAYQGMACYGMYDPNVIEYEKVMIYLDLEAQRQFASI